MHFKLSKIIKLRKRSITCFMLLDRKLDSDIDKEIVEILCEDFM